MNQQITVGIIEDYDPKVFPSHAQTDEALDYAAGALSVAVKSTWLPTPSLTEPSRAETLGRFDGLWCAPGSPYQSMDGALRAIRFAREMGRPFFAT
jgi:CTP synthase (UTP-ammonia lyase)